MEEWFALRRTAISHGKEKALNEAYPWQGKDEEVHKRNLRNGTRKGTTGISYPKIQYGSTLTEGLEGNVVEHRGRRHQCINAITRIINGDMASVM